MSTFEYPNMSTFVYPNMSTIRVHMSTQMCLIVCNQIVSKFRVKLGINVYPNVSTFEHPNMSTIRVYVCAPIGLICVPNVANLVSN